MTPKKIQAFTRRPELAHRLESLVGLTESEIAFSRRAGDDIVNEQIDAGTRLIAIDLAGPGGGNLPRISDLASDNDDLAFLLIVSEAMLPSLRIPVHITCDFVCDSASDAELAARIRRLVNPGEESADKEFVRQGPLTLNLATYQVKIDGEPVDFTYLEYALLAFLITHPGRTYSRDALLNRVWDFDYYGGSRTVDVHVRRIRAKLGPDLAQHLETVRGVGYLWNY